jgi:RNA polymerase sigma factor (sigma-70 family)
LIATAGTEASDCSLVDAVRHGDECAFEELYRRYHSRIAGFVRSMLHDEARAEDVAQEAFLSALKRMRATDAEINFKPWIYQIARNAAIDSYRRTSHAVEVSMDADDGLRASDRQRLVGLDGGPDAALVTKERLSHLQGAFDELSDVHTKVLVMRELEGMSYREIGDKLDLTRPAVESALFRARRRLESEYQEIADGRRCTAMRSTLARMVEGTHRASEEHRLARHIKRCHSCRHRARVLGIEPRSTLGTLRDKAAALLPLPWLFRRSGGDGGITGLFSTGANAAPLAERAAALVAAAVLVGAGGAALSGGALRGDHGTKGEKRHAVEQSTVVRGESQRGKAGPATDGERAGSRQTSGRRASGPAGGRAGDSDRSSGTTGGSTPDRSSGDAGSGLPNPAGAVPSLPDTSTPSTDAAPRLQLPVPEVPQVITPPQENQVLPGVQVPDTGVPAVDDATQPVQDLTDGLQNSLP